MKSSEGLIRLIAFCLVGLAWAAVSGRLTAHTVNDTPSYVDYPFGSLDEALISIRTPGYPLFLAAVVATVGLSLVPTLHVMLHATASWFLGEELIRRGMPIRSSLVASFCVLVGCTATDNINTISTDAPAASLGVITVVFLMRTCRELTAVNIAGCTAFAIVTIFVRPAYLFLIPWIPVASWLLDRRQILTQHSQHPNRWIGAKISLVVCIALLGWMLLRKSVVDDFGIAPFGHQNLSAILVQTVPPPTLRDLPGEVGEFGTMIADELETQDLTLPTSPGYLAPTLTIENQWGQINYGVIWPLARSNYRDADAADSVAPIINQHRRIAALNKAILAAAPAGYFRWLLLAARRAVWGTAANITMHPVFLTMILLGLFVVLRRAVTQRSLDSITFPDGWAAFAIVAITYAVFSIGFVILTSPPLGRFADAGAIFFPSLVACLMVTPKRGETPSTD